MEVKMVRSVHSWHCECCGYISDTFLSVLLDGKVLGEHQDDGHFGAAVINDLEVETQLVEALGAQTEYAILCSRREALQDSLELALDAAQSDEEEAAAYHAHSVGRVAFGDWLETLGHTFVEESHYTESPRYDYDEDGYPQQYGADEDESDGEGHAASAGLEAADACDYPGARYENAYPDQL